MKLGFSQLHLLAVFTAVWTVSSSEAVTRRSDFNLLHEGATISGNINQQLRAVSPIQCIRRCNEDPECKAYQFTKKGLDDGNDKNNCVLISQVYDENTAHSFQVDSQYNFYKKDFCTNDPCLNGTCEDGPENATCNCFHGYRGSKCEINIDECESQPCENNGTCQDGINQYSCNCVPGFYGSNCQNFDACFSNPCTNNGTCNIFNTVEYQCDCSDGFLGVNCEEPDDCLSQPCQNGGSCTDGDQMHICTCSDGWAGSECQDVDECYPNHECHNGATCVDGANTYTCVCTPGWSGPFCNETDDCHPLNPCQNDGNCTDGDNDFSCECTPGYTGDTCETNIDECGSAPCENSGSCMDEVNSYSCQCVDGWNGTDCENNIDDCAFNPCLRAGTCVDRVNSFVCECGEEYTGSLCQIPCANGTGDTWSFPTNWTTAGPDFYFDYETVNCITVNIRTSPYIWQIEGQRGYGAAGIRSKGTLTMVGLEDFCVLDPVTCDPHGGALSIWWKRMQQSNVELSILGPGGFTHQVTISSVPTGWFHLVLNVESVTQTTSGGFKVYWDGVLKGSSTVGAGSNTNSGKTLTVPFNYLCTLDFDELTLWNRLLTEDEIELIYKKDA